MQVATALVLLTCELCLAIRVPVNWDESASEVKQEIKNENEGQFSVDSTKPENLNARDETPIPVEYFQYTAKKPQFAIDVANFHGVQSPQNHYKSYPIKPYTGKTRPELGKHHLLDNVNTIHKPLQEFANINEDLVSHAVPVSSNYEVFHPYEAETPALQEIYKDPILKKIRNDLENSKNRLQAHEKDEGKPDIHKDEYLESPEKTDNRFIPHKNVLAPYEIHRPQRRPIYYRPIAKNPQREHYLNQRLRHPWNQFSAKIRPMHYRPVKNHLHQLRQNHALKYDDERNEYPQVQILENHSSDPKDGYDIYERGKEKFKQLRNNVDESINKAVKENHPPIYDKLEMQKNEYTSNYDEEDEFVPIKNYAQVRKTETFKHLPQSAALADAESFDEIRNAPRLREAVKSTKAQTVYSEEGYEDSAYDHAGEQKHASENEGHGGYLKEHELSGGKYKTPSESAKYEDGFGSTFRDQIVHAEKWKGDNKNNAEETEEEDYAEDENEKSIEADGYSSPEDGIHRNKRENIVNSTDTNFTTQINTMNITDEHDIGKRNAYFKVPELDLISTFLTEQEILQLSKIKLEKKKDDIKQKYPYYFKHLKAISEHSPLRYAENLKLIPKKSKGGTEFYDSRSKFECPEVDDVPDPIPEKLKHDDHPDENNDDEENSSKKGDENYDTVKKTPRLKGLGDKIDCFKAKYFGENPLDSPFFKEEIISKPEPVTVPNLSFYKLKVSPDKELISIKNKDLDLINSNREIFEIVEKLRNTQGGSLNKLNADLASANETVNVNKKDNNVLNQSNVYSDTLDNIKNSLKINEGISDGSANVTETVGKPFVYLLNNNTTYKNFPNKDHVTHLPPALRKRRSTSFVYEPYKIIRDSQVQDSKKTTTTSNISPLIRQLQSSRVVDRVPKFTQEGDSSEKYVKRNINSRVYKDIGRKDRKPNGSKNDKSFIDPTFVDISIDSRRGEPRYEIHTNHKSRYTPVVNKKSMSMAEYKSQSSTEKSSEIHRKGEIDVQRQPRQKNPNIRSYSNSDVQNVAESSNTVRKMISTTTTSRPKQNENLNQRQENIESEEDYSDEDYDDDDEEDEENEESPLTTTTEKPIFRRRIKLTTTTEKLPESTEKPKLELITRFRDHKPIPRIRTQENPSNEQIVQNRKPEKAKTQELDESLPKYREKKKKSSKSTLVTDTKKYGDDNDDDMRKEEVDALIGVKQDMDDYMPQYEKDEESKSYRNHSNDRDDDEETESDESEDNVTNKKNDENNDDINNEDDDDDDETVDDEDDEDENDEEEEDETEDKDGSREQKPQITTPEPTKRTLAITTDVPNPTFATRHIQPETKPIVKRKKIEIHKELPANTSAPHATQFKQDIKEEEIIKEIPRPSKRKHQKNLEALELYKDDNLAKDVNKLGGVEVFKEGIDLKNGPKHGGNYRSLEPTELPEAALLKEARKTSIKDDTVASQSEFTKKIELDDEIPSTKMHGGNLRSRNDEHNVFKSQGRSSKLIELSDTPVRSMHGGNLRHRDRSRPTSKSEKFVELDDDERHERQDTSNDHESFSHSANSGPLHGGNYRSEQLVVEKKPESHENPTKSRARGARRNSAAILNSFVQAAPILTTTPAYILDPSKRMYYYVDA